MTCMSSLFLRCVLAAAVLLLTGAASPGDESAAPANVAKSFAFVDLFNGASLDGWVEVGTTNGWTIENGELCATGPGSGWLRTARQYRDFEMTLEFMVPPGGNSGIAIRSTREGNPAFTGFELQILDTHGQPPAVNNCGAVYDAIAPRVMAVKPAGEWNRMHIAVEGDRLTVHMNNQCIHERERLNDRGFIYNPEDAHPLNARAQAGYIALQHYGDPVRYRNIRLLDLTRPRAEFSAMLFTRTMGFRHDSIPAGVEAIERLGLLNRFTVDHTEDAGRFTDESLEPHAAVIFLSTTGDVLNSEQEAALQRFIQKGRGFVGIHAAADTEYDWPWYGELVGAYFKSHPQVQEASLRVLDPDHPSTQHLPTPWVRTDEWYNYRAQPCSSPPPSPARRGVVRLLLELDRSSYKGSEMEPTHPIAWCQEFDGGRAWYTGLGHTIESFTEQEFLDHCRGGILWAAGRNPMPATNTGTAPSDRSTAP